MIARQGLGRQAMRITADTNVLVRAVTETITRTKAKPRKRPLKAADLVAIPIPSLC